MSLNPVTAFWNKNYSTGLGPHLRAALVAFHKQVGELLQISEQNTYAKNGVFFADDCLIVFRNLGFLEDSDFIKAVGPRSADKVLMGRIWRLWFISWSLSVQWPSEGCIVDLGSYNGKALFTACKYAHLRHKSVPIDSQFLIIADLFENPPRESRKADHSPSLHLEVQNLFGAFKSKAVVKGFVPESISHIDFSKGIKWCQIDLNSAESDLKAFEFIYDKLLPGSHVIFDDYGFSRYKNTQLALDQFLSEKRERVFELPTGQGLLIKSQE